MTFYQKLSAACERTNSLVCIGLDPDIDKLPLECLRSVSGILEFNKAIIRATAQLVAAYKPNAAFYEQYGLDGVQVLEDTIAFIRQEAPHAVVILDAKRGDIGNTSRAYARAVFESMGADAVTLAPYMGYDSLKPFFDHPDKGCFVLCRTSNPGGADLQDLAVGDRSLYEVVASKCVSWNANSNIGLVVGATAPSELALVREITGPDMPFLVPGIGAQGGDPGAVMKNGIGGGRHNLLINSSRGIIFAGRGEGYAADAAEAALQLRDKLNSLL